MSHSQASKRESNTSDEAKRLSPHGMLTQTWAIFVDAYRELDAKKLFWITMGLSVFVVAAFSVVSFDEQGVWIFGKLFRNPLLNTLMVPRATLYKGLFIDLGVSWWLALGGILLALISTATIFPDLLSGGAVDLYLARPLGRVRLFLTKYVVGLLFVAVQVTVFCVASVLVLWLRGGIWVPGIFLAVPLVTLLFSYLWSISALVGTLTRSTIAALLLTVLAWLVIFGVYSSEWLLLRASVGSQIQTRELDRVIANYDAELSAIDKKTATTEPTAYERGRLKFITLNLPSLKIERATVNDSYAMWHDIAYAVKWPLPKTAEMTKLLERWLGTQFRPPRDRRELPTTMSDEPDRATSYSAFRNPQTRMAVMAEVDRVTSNRSATWVIGTSLMFEGVMVGLAAWVFARRDY